jgi:hypothetical protein
MRLFLVIALAAKACANPWDKYMLSPGPERILLPVSWHHTPAGSTPPQPQATCPARTVGGVVDEWDGEPGAKSAQLTLACAGGETILEVSFASFGTPTGVCGAYIDGDCDAANASEYVARLCVGKESCTIPADPTARDGQSALVQQLGDPCQGKIKRLALQLSGCSGSATPPQPPLPVRLQGKGDSVLYDPTCAIRSVRFFECAVCPL